MKDSRSIAVGAVLLLTVSACAFEDSSLFPVSTFVVLGIAAVALLLARAPGGPR